MRLLGILLTFHLVPVLVLFRAADLERAQQMITVSPSGRMAAADALLLR